MAGIIIMLKYPKPGMVKTRLGKELGGERAAELYRTFVACELDTVQSLQVPILLSCHPYQPLSAYRDWLGGEYRYISQGDGDLGVKMRTSFETAFDQGLSRAVLIGSDLPHLPAAYIQSALTRLQDHDAVIGPALDGGYYLIGLQGRSFHPGMFEEIPWSTSQVLALTQKRLGDYDLKTFLLPSLRDIDTLEDLKSLLTAQDLPVEPQALEQSIRYLVNSSLIGSQDEEGSHAQTRGERRLVPGLISSAPFIGNF
ncbi:MAG: TIGR04282 family arsenosugar biosynthesis glycosyltransferase [Desulfovermiculus sp.]|nr:TIGR04282 family arsenosugar biosynthesis glycosyltransferase [Desulfovermiculus sp.]